MTTYQSNNQTFIPNLPNTKLVDSNGNIDPTWYQFFSQLINSLQTIVSTAGIKIPQQYSDTIVNILDTSDPAKIPKVKGNLVYDITNNQLMININGTYKVIPYTP